MAYTTINKSSLHFNTLLWQGNGNNARALTGVGFQPDFTWIKDRTDTESHCLTDAVRGATKSLRSNGNNAEATDTDALQSFNSDGFTVGNQGQVNKSNGDYYVGWNWKGNGAGSSNSDGDITSTVSANTTAGFSIVKFTANGTNNGTTGHGLGAAPKIIFYKRLDSTEDWFVVYKFVDDSLDFLKLNATDAKTDLTLGTYGFSTSTTITNLGFGNGNSMIAYCFAEKQGYSKFGSYTGNGDADGTFIYTGFKPSLVMIKRTSGSDRWVIMDNKRDIDNPTQKELNPNATTAESSADTFDFTSNGFKLRRTGNVYNTSGQTYLYMAFGQTLVGSNNVPALAR